jgi:hypothetical protein
MASTTLPPRQQPGAPARPAPTLVPGGGRQRRWSLALLAVLVTLGSALAFVVLWMNAGDREPVLALARDVEAGQTFTADDLKVVRVSTDPGITPIASSARDQVIGQTASVELLAGTLLVPDAVGSSEGLDANTEIVPIALPTTGVPAGLERGDRVRIYLTPQSAGGVQGAAEQIAEGRVLEVKQGDGSETAVSVSVDADRSGAIVSGAMNDQIGITKASAED